MGHLYHIPFSQGSGDTKEEGTEREKPEGLQGSRQHCLLDIPGMLQPGTLKNCAMVDKICPGRNLSTFWRGKGRAPWSTPIRGAADCQWLPLRSSQFSSEVWPQVGYRCPSGQPHTHAQMGSASHTLQWVGYTTTTKKGEDRKKLDGREEEEDIPGRTEGKHEG